jgi:hypothetical protein
MASTSLLSRAFIVGLVSVLLAYTYGPAVQRFLTCIGTFRTAASTLVDPGDLVIIDDTIHCEDLHYYAPSGEIFTACEDSNTLRFSWFPALGLFGDTEAAAKAKGSIHVIDPKVSWKFYCKTVSDQTRT